MVKKSYSILHDAVSGSFSGYTKCNQDSMPVNDEEKQKGLKDGTYKLKGKALYKKQSKDGADYAAQRLLPFVEIEDAATFDKAAFDSAMLEWQKACDKLASEGKYAGDLVVKGPNGNLTRQKVDLDFSLYTSKGRMDLDWKKGLKTSWADIAKMLNQAVKQLNQAQISAALKKQHGLEEESKATGAGFEII